MIRARSLSSPLIEEEGIEGFRKVDKGNRELSPHEISTMTTRGRSDRNGIIASTWPVYNEKMKMSNMKKNDDTNKRQREDISATHRSQPKTMNDADTLSSYTCFTSRKRNIFHLSTPLVVLFLFLVPQFQQQPSLKHVSAILQSSTSHKTSPTPSGPIDDATCDVEELEVANDSQLHGILLELKQTAFFRNFAVDLTQVCPLSTLGPKFPPKKGVEKEDNMGGKVPKPSSFTSSLPIKSRPKSFLNALPFGNSAGAPAADGLCSGGLEDAEPDAEPACHVALDEDTSSTLPWNDETERNTFQWSQQTDMVITSQDDDGEPCKEDELVGEAHLPETFWLDMCSKISMNDGSPKNIVNLVINPERNTGYNGTHIWDAIYKENCLIDGKPSDIAPMCYEERVLHRLLSGLHTSTTLSIAKNYHPPNKRKGRTSWEPNPAYFWKKFDHHPEYIRNLHFSYVVLLRALKKAGPFLYQYDIRTGNIVEDETATILLRRLLDSTILQSCSSVFEAFDESLMFRENCTDDENNDTSTCAPEVISLKQNFKQVFHKVSSILDCVQCQQCKLHGKMAMLGYGAALKILFLSSDELIASSLDRNEIVALVNTVAKISESLKEIRELTTLYWDDKQQNERQEEAQQKESLIPTTTTIPTISFPSQVTYAKDPVDAAIGAIATLGQNSKITPERETELIRMALFKHSDLLTLAKYYANTNLDKFLQYTQLLTTTSTDIDLQKPEERPLDAIVIGSGLAGLAATLHLLDRGGKVLLIEKEHSLGGNSNKASSGINACCPTNTTILPTDKSDELEIFRSDTIRSAGDSARLPLIDTLVSRSAEAVTWLRERVGVDLSLVAQLGGHQRKRTHRPQNGMVGAEVIFGMQRAVKSYEKSGQVVILMDTKVTQLVTETEEDINNNANDGIAPPVTGVQVEYLLPNPIHPNRTTAIWKAPNTILATGGFAADRTTTSYLAQYRPELLNMPATAGEFSTGDGIGLATPLGAALVDMDKVQIHPTGWVNPEDPHNPNKVLAAELMRGVGGILINSSGQRFCNELGTRAYVTDQMLGHDREYNETKKWKQSNDIPTFSLVLASSAAADGKKHVDHYVHKKLLQKFYGVDDLAKWMNVTTDTLRQTMIQYRSDGQKGIDMYGKSSFRGMPTANLEDEIFYAGTVTPVLHYCMGGITIDTDANVIDGNGNIIPGLHAAGEVTGGVHGNNRLGGNSLLECTVYGSLIGKKLPIATHPTSIPTSSMMDNTSLTQASKVSLRNVSLEELAEHDTPEDCWVAIHGKVYDLTDFAEEHPAGAESIYKLGGKDGTEAFATVHSEGLMDDFDEDLIGVLLQ